MDTKLFKKTYPYICAHCGEFAHTFHEFCEVCGKNGLRKAKSKDYKNRK
jgi:rRNA maturation endonuclease Nob1